MRLLFGFVHFRFFAACQEECGYEDCYEESHADGEQVLGIAEVSAEVCDCFEHIWGFLVENVGRKAAVPTGFFVVGYTGIHESFSG